MSTIIQTGSREPLLVDTSDDIDCEVFHQDSAGDAVDLTGYVITWTFTVGAESITATIGDGLTVDVLAGKITLHIPVADLVDFPQGLGTHRLQVTSPVDKTLMRGALVNDT